MSIQHHPLVTEFPDHRDTIHTLKQENAHFRKLMEEYEEIDKEISAMKLSVNSRARVVATEFLQQFV